jgi:DNA-binding GntR family transcriptional regulator
MPASASARIYNDLRIRIINLDLKPDTSLSRKELSAGYGVSLTPIREALQRLEQEGLVRIFPQSKTVVTRIDQSELREAHFLRVALETEVVRRITAAADRRVIERLRSIVRMQETLAGDADQTEMFYELDRAFHRTNFEVLGLRATHALLSARQGHFARCQRLELPKDGRMAQILADHSKVVDSIESGDPGRAADAMRNHFNGTIRRVSQLSEEFPEYFEASCAPPT